MVQLILIEIEEFEKDLYNKYIKIFPEEEQRKWEKIVKTYNCGIEKFYKIVLNQTTIGFFMLEKIDECPYYLDYFAIFKEYRNKGYGSQAINKLMEIIEKESDLCCEIEQVDSNIPITTKRWKFYENLGFKQINSLYLLYDVLYSPLILSNREYKKEEIDKVLFTYYNINCGFEEVKKNCKIL